MGRRLIFARALATCAVLAFATASLVGFRSAASTGPVGRIVFTANVGGRSDLYVVNANGTQLRRLTRDGTSQSPTWSPDGHSIAFVHYGSAANPSANALVRMPATGGQLVNLVSGPLKGAFLADPAWSPNGKWIAYESSDGIDLDPVSGGQPVTAIQGSAFRPSWSPDSQQIAYCTLNTAGHPSVFIADANGGNAHDVSQAPVDDESAVWSADGKWIAMRSLNADWQQDEEDSLVLVSPDGSNRRTLISGGVIFPVASSPSGDAVLALRKDPKVIGGQLWIVPVNGGPPRPVPGTRNAVGRASWHR